MEIPRSEKFFLDVREAATLVPPPVVRADFDLRDPRMLAAAGAWLKPQTVDHYNASDFAAAPEVLRKKLDQTVGRFREKANGVPSGKPVTPDQFLHGWDAFKNMADVLG